MNILVYGAGVIGTLYASRLRQAGHRVTVFARGDRLADIRRYGLVLEDVLGGGRSTTQVDTTQRLGPDDQYDVALITVRRDQLASALPDLTANRRIPTMLFLLNGKRRRTPVGIATGQRRRQEAQERHPGCPSRGDTRTLSHSPLSGLKAR
jgi:2-dehydropantoate 2-reductase